MKKFAALTFLIMFAVCRAPAQLRLLSVSGGITRSAPVTTRDFRLGQFAASVTLGVRLNRRVTFNIGLSKAFERRPLSLRTGISFRFY